MKDIEEVLDIIAISHIDEYLALKDSSMWDYYIAGLSYGVYVSIANTDSLTIENIKLKIETKILILIN